MKVLSIRQPYASLLVLGVKRIEARTWQTDYRGPVLIHASSGNHNAALRNEIETRRGVFNATKQLGWTHSGVLDQLPRSAVIGQATLVDVIPSFDYESDDDSTDYVLAAFPSDDMYYWLFDDRIAIEPVPVHGKLRLWTLPEDLDTAVSDAVARSKEKPARWTIERPNSGDEFKLVLVQPSAPLAAIVGAGPTTLWEAFDKIVAYADEHDLMTAQSIELDANISFLAPGKARIKGPAMVDAIRNHATPL